MELWRNLPHFSGTEAQAAGPERLGDPWFTPSALELYEICVTCHNRPTAVALHRSAPWLLTVTALLVEGTGPVVSPSSVIDTNSGRNDGWRETGAPVSLQYGWNVSFSAENPVGVKIVHFSEVLSPLHSPAKNANGGRQSYQACCQGGSCAEDRYVL